MAVVNARSRKAIRLSCLVALLVGAQPAPALQGSAGATVAPSVAPDSGALLGAWVGNRDEIPHYDSVLKFEKQIGRKLAIDQHFRSWDNKFWGEETKDVAAGRIPMITWGDWGKTSAGEIASGSHDALIRQKAAAMKALGAPLFLRWGAEMAGGKYGTAEEYIAAWKRLRALFADEGATNVLWVWCPTAWGVATGDAQEYYPGDAHVDWIAANGFNFYPAKGPWKSFREIFKGFYAWASKRGKPLMIGGTGAMEDPDVPGRKAEWISDIVGTLKDWPKIKAFNYFHALSPKGYDFWVDTSKSSMDAFVDLAQHPYLNHGGSPSGSSPACTVTGTAGDDLLLGTKSRDVICGFGGDDVLKGFRGNDSLYGGPGKDVVRGGAGSDRMYGKGASDRLVGGKGRDRQFGGAGSDRLTGGAGNDDQAGGKGWDRCSQGPGAGSQTSCEVPG